MVYYLAIMKRLLITLCLLSAGAASAKWTPAMISIVTPVQAPSSEYDVRGLRLSLIYGDCASFTGLDIGIIGHADKSFTGLGIGGANITDERFLGGHLGLVNWNNNALTPWDQRSKGVQFGVFNYAGGFCGLQDGLVNVSDSSFAGLQSAFFNYAKDLQGAQMGCYFLLGVNIASGEMTGCQLGLVNYAERVRDGLQIGLVNIISENGWMPVLPIVNGRF